MPGFINRMEEAGFLSENSKRPQLIVPFSEVISGRVFGK